VRCWRNGLSKTYALAVAVALIIAGVAGYYVWIHTHPTSPPAPTPPKVAWNVSSIKPLPTREAMPLTTEGLRIAVSQVYIQIVKYFVNGGLKPPSLTALAVGAYMRVDGVYLAAEPPLSNSSFNVKVGIGLNVINMLSPASASAACGASSCLKAPVKNYGNVSLSVWGSRVNSSCIRFTAVLYAKGQKSSLTEELIFGGKSARLVGLTPTGAKIVTSYDRSTWVPKYANFAGVAKVIFNYSSGVLRFEGSGGRKAVIKDGAALVKALVTGLRAVNATLIKRSPPTYLVGLAISSNATVGGYRVSVRGGGEAELVYLGGGKALVLGYRITSLTVRVDGGGKTCCVRLTQPLNFYPSVKPA